jgi:hypothetical protein
LFVGYTFSSRLEQVVADAFNWWRHGVLGYSQKAIMSLLKCQKNTLSKNTIYYMYIMNNWTTK